VFCWIHDSSNHPGREAAGEQRDLLLSHAERIEAQVATLRTHLDYLHVKAALWDGRERGDRDAEAEAICECRT
jgi:MerR family transcriptional regulator, copper efflux regulator